MGGGNDEESEVMPHVMGLDLSDREIFAIGKIIALFGAIEHEIFQQTVLFFADAEECELPKEMNNSQFSRVLDLWVQTVVAGSEHKKILLKQYDTIRHFSEYRHSIVHGMLSWDASKLDVVTSTRVLRKNIISIDYSVDDLEHFATELGKVNFKIRFPGGLRQYADKMSGFHISRRGFELLFGKKLPK